MLWKNTDDILFIRKLAYETEHYYYIYKDTHFTVLIPSLNFGSKQYGFLFELKTLSSSFL